MKIISEGIVRIKRRLIKLIQFILNYSEGINEYLSDTEINLSVVHVKLKLSMYVSLQIKKHLLN